MSSLAATQADGYYAPPEYYESGAYKKQSKSQYNHNSKGHNAYMTHGIVRFELPYKGICQSCKASIGRGTRYNALKKKTNEMYFTTPIYEFVMKCRVTNCQQEFCIVTNPKERGFDYKSGITIQQGQQQRLQQPEQSELDAALQLPSSLDQLEKAAIGKRQTMTDYDQLQSLQKLNQHSSHQDAHYNSIVRKRFRQDRNTKRQQQAQAMELGWKDGMQVVAPNAQDAATAKRELNEKMQHHTKHSKRNINSTQTRMTKIRQSNIFGQPKKKHKVATRQRFHDTHDTIVPEPTRSLSSFTFKSCSVAATSPDRVASATNNKHSTANIGSNEFLQKKKLIVCLSNANGGRITAQSKKRPPSPPCNSTLSSMLEGYGSESDGST